MSPLIFASCRDCPSYLAFAETVLDLLLPAETTVHEKWLPAETVRVFLLPAESPAEKEAIYQAQQSRQEARDRGQYRPKPNMTDSLCRKRKLADSFISCGASPGKALNPSNKRTKLFTLQEIPKEQALLPCEASRKPQRGSYRSCSPSLKVR